MLKDMLKEMTKTKIRFAQMQTLFFYPSITSSSIIKAKPETIPIVEKYG